jgi:hypothetical protein
MRKSSATAAALAALIACAGAQAQRPAHTLELRATYCVAVLQYELALFNSMPADTPPEIQGGIAEEEFRASENLKRLQAFLKPRIASINPADLAMALESGDGDAQRAVLEASRCVESCADDAHPEACRQRCKQRSEVLQRVGICADTSWYPI